MRGVLSPAQIQTAQEATRRPTSVYSVRQVSQFHLSMHLRAGWWSGLCGRVFEAFVQQQLEDALSYSGPYVCVTMRNYLAPVRRIRYRMRT